MEASKSLVSTQDSDVVTAAAGLMTIFLDTSPKGRFGTQAFRQLLQMLAATLVSDAPDYRDNSDEIDESSYRIVPQQLTYLFDRWEQEKWIRAADSKSQGRGNKQYQVTEFGAANLMTVICQCVEPLRANKVDRLLAALFVVESFPIGSIRKQLPEIRNHFSADGSLSAKEWSVRHMKQHFVQSLSDRIDAQKDLIKNLDAADKKIREYRPKWERLDLGRIAKTTQVVRTPKGNEYYHEGQKIEVPPELDFYFPALFAFKNQRDNRSSEEIGLQPLLNLYREFNEDFIRWHLFQGIGGLRRLYEGHRRSLESTRAIVREWRPTRSLTR